MRRKLILTFFILILSSTFLYAAQYYLPNQMATLFPPEPIRMPKMVPPRAPKKFVVQALDPVTQKLQKAPLIQPFPRKVAPDLQKRVDFWKKVYSRYRKNQDIIHDVKTLEIYTVLDFSKLESSYFTPAQKRKIRETYVDQEIQKILRTIPELKDRLRVQSGRSEAFGQAIALSGRYLEEIETIFDSYGLPRELTRLVFVESMFYNHATSNVGAAGIWQLMPNTAARYLTVTSLIDERRDPVLSTHAAAKLLKANLYTLGTWPLAVNAYNSGAARLQNAIKQLRTEEISAIIEQYDSPGYGFASQNFYPEFLAALEIYENRTKYFPHITPEPPLRYEIVTLPAPMSMVEVANLTEMDLEELAALNPAFSEAYLQEDRYLAEGTNLRVNKGGFALFTMVTENLWKTQKKGVWHTVNSGETVLDIANKYQIPIETLLKHNDIEQNRIYIGQVLKIPPEAVLP